MTTENAPTIRPRTPADTAACVQALAEVHHRDGYPVNWPADPGDWLCAASGLGAWTAELDGHLVGHVALTPSGEGDAAPALWGDPRATAVVSRLFVTPRARGHGIGALLLDRAAAEAHHRGLHPVLDVVTSDTAAAALYERLGWQHLATVEQHWSRAQTVTVHCYAGPGAR
ncbi:GNAT family N-acetyltransferase [Streptomyces roseirectus]|uniref:GNAT family N-acetyltransferase n=1 Tax=Streptomyces roseirectus TaxID=2768066 RepID=A0A7H0IQK3_9ACTN|nr:GNAT family N-acetyltransferase [Streptomyces roseirectus]QNP75069.1 GNAT family N-acetyltransferase [Streptomyces roseirectus]